MAGAGLRCEALTFVRSGGPTVLSEVTADFPAGRAVLVNGPTGAGKSTLLHLLAGLLRPTSGEIQVDGAPVSRWTAAHQELHRRQVGIMFQNLHLMDDLSLLENVLLPCVPSIPTWQPAVARARDLLERLDLAALQHQPVHTLSGGQRQRVALARALIRQPRILLLDEPSAFQDDGHTRRLLDLCRQAAGQGACVVVCSHDMRLRSAQRLFDPVYRLERASLRSCP